MSAFIAAGILAPSPDPNVDAIGNETDANAIEATATGNSALDDMLGMRRATAPAQVATPTLTPAPAPMPTATPVELISEVLPITQPANAPASVPATSPANLPVPAGTRVVRGECTSDGECHSFNFYWAPTHEAVVLPNEPYRKVQHELCHAHQHWSINQGAPLAPSDYDLESWYGTAEGRSFTSAVAGRYWPWSHSAVNGLEDFAWTCTYWYVDPGYLRDVSPARYEWAAANLP